jgi:hypothetical protein
MNIIFLSLVTRGSALVAQYLLRAWIHPEHAVNPIIAGEINMLGPLRFIHAGLNKKMRKKNPIFSSFF